MFALNNSIMPAPLIALVAKQFAKKKGKEIMKDVVKDGKKIIKKTINDVKKDPRNALDTIQTNAKDMASRTRSNVESSMKSSVPSGITSKMPLLSGNFNKLIDKNSAALSAASSNAMTSINPAKKSKYDARTMNPFKNAKFDVRTMNPFKNAKFESRSRNPFKNTEFDVGAMNPFKNHKFESRSMNSLQHTKPWKPFKNTKPWKPFKNTKPWKPFKNTNPWNPFKSIKSMIPTSLLSGLFSKTITDGNDGNDDKNTNFQYELLKAELEDKYATNKINVDALLEKQKASMMKTNNWSSVGMFGMIVLVYYMVEISKQSYLSWTTNHIAPTNDPATMSKIVWCVVLCCFGMYAIFQASNTATNTVCTSMLSFMMVLTVVEYLSKTWYFFQPLTLRDPNGLRSSCLYSEYLLPNKPGFFHNGSCATTNTSNNFVQVKHSNPMNLSGKYTVDLSNNTATNDKHRAQLVMSTIQGIVLTVLYGIVYFV